MLKLAPKKVPYTQTSKKRPPLPPTSESPAPGADGILIGRLPLTYAFSIPGFTSLQKLVARLPRALKLK